MSKETPREPLLNEISSDLVLLGEATIADELASLDEELSELAREIEPRTTPEPPVHLDDGMRKKLMRKKALRLGITSPVVQPKPSLVLDENKEYPPELSDLLLMKEKLMKKKALLPGFKRIQPQHVPPVESDESSEYSHKRDLSLGNFGIISEYPIWEKGNNEENIYDEYIFTSKSGENGSPSDQEVIQSIEDRKKLLVQPRLSFAEEQELARRIESGKNASTLLAEDRQLEPEMIKKFGLEIEEGKEARRIFIEANITLVKFALRSFLKKGLDDDDVMQAGMLGLIQAVDHFDYRRGFRFSTFACKVIRQQVRRHLFQTLRPIRYPERVEEALYAHTLADNRLQMTLSRQPTLPEVAQEMGITLARSRLFNHLKYNKPRSLDYTTAEGMSLFDKISSPNNEVDIATFADKFVIFANESFTSREKEVAMMLLFSGGEEDVTNEEMGKTLSLSRETVRKIRKTVEAKLLQFIEDYIIDD